MPRHYFILSNDHLLLIKENDAYHLPHETHLAKLSPFIDEVYPLFPWHPGEYFLARLKEAEKLPEGMSLLPLRDIIHAFDEDTFQLAGKARQILEWQLNHQFCGRCGNKTELFDRGRAKKCIVCGLVNYPRIAPCMIVAIVKGKEILLARPARFPNATYSVLAGFIEPGENAETCVHREVFEEVGLIIHPPRYISSQVWPFPHQLMLGFIAEYQSGLITPDPEEIGDAQWFPFDQLPPLPPTYSLSYQLIQKAIQFTL